MQLTHCGLATPDGGRDPDYVLSSYKNHYLQALVIMMQFNIE